MGSRDDTHRRSQRLYAALAAAAVAWAVVAAVVLRSDSGSCGGSLGGALLTLGVWTLALGWAVRFVVVAPDRRSPRVVIPVAVVLVVLLGAAATFVGLACG